MYAFLVIIDVVIAMINIIIIVMIARCIVINGYKLGIIMYVNIIVQLVIFIQQPVLIMDSLLLLQEADFAQLAILIVDFALIRLVNVTCVEMDHF